MLLRRQLRMRVDLAVEVLELGHDAVQAGERRLAAGPLGHAGSSSRRIRPPTPGDRLQRLLPRRANARITRLAPPRDRGFVPAADQDNGSRRWTSRTASTPR